MADLKAIADLKITQIESWRQQRLADARMNSSGIVRQYVSKWCRDWKDDSPKNEIMSRLQFFRENEGYQNMILADLEGRIQVSLDSRVTVLEPETKRLSDNAISLNQPVFGDFFFCPICGDIHLDVATPVLNEIDQPVAVLILRTDPMQHFFPYIQSLPISWESAETILARIEDHQTLVLNILRQHTDSSLNLRLEHSNNGIQDILATCGKGGECSFQDYRGIDVLGEIRSVKNSNWFVIVKVDSHEIFSEINYRKYAIGIFTAAIILLMGLSAGLLINYVEKVQLKLQRITERVERDAREKAREEIQEALIRNISQTNATLEQRILKRTRELEKAHAQIILQEKMASIGQLAAGIAHELNNPLNFISMNFNMLSEYCEEIIDILQKYRSSTIAMNDTDSSLTDITAIQHRENEVNLDYILKDMPVLLKESRSGFERIARIIQSIRDFSKVDNTGDQTMFNINSGIEDTLVIAKNQYKYCSDVTADLGELPDILCFPEQLNYVFLNLILNSAHAISMLNRPAKGRIAIRTWQDELNVYCDIADDGPGIPSDIRNQIFDPFFTTKPPGEGIGLGLSTSYDVIVRRHQGGMGFHCPESGGTVFSIRIPKRL